MHMMWCTTGFESFIGAGLASRLNDTPDRWILSSHPSIGFVGERMWHLSEANEKGWVLARTESTTPGLGIREV